MKESIVIAILHNPNLYDSALHEYKLLQRCDTVCGQSLVGTLHTAEHTYCTVCILYLLVVPFPCTHMMLTATNRDAPLNCYKR